MDWLEKVFEVPLYALGFWFLGNLVLLPGMVLGRWMDEPGVPKWQPQVAITILGAIAAAIIFRGNFGN